MNNSSERFLFVVDTDQYSGNFERELCGFVTGRWDGETHGGREAESAAAELPADILGYLGLHVIECPETPDDIPIFTPVIAYPTPGWWNDGHGKHFKGEPPQGAYPAYQSVAIFMDERPPQHVFDMLVARAQTFCAYYRGLCGQLEPIGFIGVRLIKETTTVTSEVLTGGN